MKPVRYQEFITREDLKSNPDTIYLFGDNLKEVGSGGQAGHMRGEPNAIGIPTLKMPEFFSDDELEDNKKAIRKAFAKIPKGKRIVIPLAGLGTGIAQLDRQAPETFAFLLECIRELEEERNIELGGR
jgi:hypothetical protein